MQYGFLSLNAKQFTFQQDLATVNITTTYTQVISASAVTSGKCYLWVSNSAANSIQIARGAAASEVVIATIPPNWAGLIPFNFGPLQRIAVRSVVGALATGQVGIDGFDMQ